MAKDKSKQIDVAVALIINRKKQILWTWNDRWGCWAFPMTRRRNGKNFNEQGSRAAERAAAKALGVPVQIDRRRAVIPLAAVSEPDWEVKLYSYDVFEARAHPDFGLDHVQRSHLWLTVDQALSRQYHPLSKPCIDIISRLVEEDQLSGRFQHTSTLILTRSVGARREFLLRWNRSWGYALPAKRHRPGETSLAAAHRVIGEELGLAPGKEIRLKKLKPESICLSDFSPKAKKWTRYTHHLFEATFPKLTAPNSSESIAWVTEREILQGRIERKVRAQARKISATAQQILTEVDYLPFRVVLN